MDGWKTNSFPFGDLAYFQVLLLLLVLREGKLFIPSVTPPSAVLPHPLSVFARRGLCPLSRWPFPAQHRRPRPRRRREANGRPPCGPLARKLGWNFLIPKGSWLYFKFFFKLALYIIPIYLGSGWSNWSDMYNVCTEISIPWVAESTTFFSRFQISVHIWLPLEVFGFQHTGATVPTTGISLDSNIANWNWEVQLSKVPATNLAMASYTNELLNCYLSPRVRIY